MRTTLQFAIREARSTIRLRYQILGLVAAVAVLAWLGPFDTWGRLALADRVAFWTLATSINWVFGLMLGFAAGLVLERRGLIAWAAAVVGGSALAAVPGTAVVWLLVAAYMDHRMPWFAEIASLYSQVIAIHLVLNALVTWLIYGKSGGKRREGRGVPVRRAKRSRPDFTPRHPPPPSSIGSPGASGATSCTSTCKTTTSRSTLTREAISSSCASGMPCARSRELTGRRSTAHTG